MLRSPSPRRSAPLAVEELERRTVPTASVSVSVLQHAAEGGAAGTFRLMRDNTAGPLTVQYALDPAATTATSGSDFAPLSGSVTFADGQAYADVAVLPQDDVLLEPTESVGIALQAGSGYNLGTPATAALTITDNDLNRPPQVSIQSFTLAENSPTGTVVGHVVASDPDAGQSLRYAITAGNSDEAFTIDSATGQISVADDISLDYERVPLFVLTVSVTDSGWPALSSTAQVTVNLLNVNEAPAASPLYIDSIGTEGSVLNLVGSDAEGSTLTVYVTSLPSRGLLYDGPDASGRLITAADLNGGGYRLTDPQSRVFYLPNSDKYGFDQFTFKVNDGTQDSAFTSAGLFVTPDGGAPVVANGVAFDYVGSGGAMALDLLGVVSDPDGDPLTITFGQPDHGSLSYDAQTGSYLYTPAANYTGATTFAFEVSDGTRNTKVEVTVFCQQGPSNVPPNVQSDISRRINQRISFGTHDNSNPGNTGNFSRFERDLGAQVRTSRNTRVGQSGSYTLNRQQTDVQFGALPTATLNANENAVRDYLATVPGVVPNSISVTTRTDIFWSITAATGTRRQLTVTLQLYLAYTYQTATTVGGQQVTTTFSGVRTVIAPAYNDFEVDLGTAR